MNNAQDVDTVTEWAVFWGTDDPNRAPTELRHITPKKGMFTFRTREAAAKWAEDNPGSTPNRIARCEVSRSRWVPVDTPDGACPHGRPADEHCRLCAGIAQRKPR